MSEIEVCPVPLCGAKAANKSTDMCDGHLRTWLTAPERKAFDFHTGTDEQYDAAVWAFCKRVSDEEAVSEDQIE